MYCSCRKLLHSDFLTSQILQERHRQSQQCPEPLPTQRFAALQGQSQIDKVQSEGLSATAALICRNRATFQNACFYIEEAPGEGSWFRFLTAFITPLKLVLLPLAELEVPEPAAVVETRGDLDKWAATSMTFLWSYEAANVESADPFMDINSSNFFVVTDSVFKAQGLLMSVAEMLPLQRVLEGLDDTLSAGSRRAAPENPGSNRALVGRSSTPQWLQHLLSSAGGVSGGGASGSGGPRDVCSRGGR